MFCITPPRGSWNARLSPFALAVAALIALTAALAACAGSEPSGDSAPSQEIPAVISHSAALDADNGQIVYVGVVLSAPARVAVEYENEFAGKFRTALSETAAIEHAVPVVRLRADAAYQYAVGVENGDGGELSYQARGEFMTGALPGVLATMRRETVGRSSLDLIMSDYRARFPEGWRQHIVMRDELGFAVWHYAVPIQAPLQAVRVQPGGGVIYQLESCCVIAITPLGEVASEISIYYGADRIHHDFLILEDERILYLNMYDSAFDVSANGKVVKREVRIHGINALDPAVGVSERVWDPTDFWDITDPAQWGTIAPDREDWLHANSLSESPGGGYIVSLRDLNQVVSISPDFQTVRWRLGGPDSDFDFPDPTDRFTRQHVATELSNGNVLLFDNQARLPEEEGGGRYSRALELRLDFESKTAAKAWEFSPEPPIYSRIVSSAYRLDNGNTLVNFGHSRDAAAIPIAIIEADAHGREVFRLETIDPPTAAAANLAPYRYRAYPGPKSIMGETMLRAPKRR